MALKMGSIWHYMDTERVQGSWVRDLKWGLGFAVSGLGMDLDGSKLWATRSMDLGWAVAFQGLESRRALALSPASLYTYKVRFRAHRCFLPRASWLNSFIGRVIAYVRNVIHDIRVYIKPYIHACIHVHVSVIVLHIIRY